MRLQSLLILFILAATVCAQEITLEKKLTKTNLSTGDAAKLTLEIYNPFNRDIPVKIIDKSIFAGNGMDIQCLEATVPPGRGRLNYEDIELYEAGEFTLDPATLTYQDPVSAEEKTIESNTLRVTVKDGGNTKTTQGRITTIYRCDGINMQRTSYSSSGPSQQNTESKEQNTDTQDIEERLSDMRQQTSQDMQPLKKQMQNELKEKRDAEANLREKIESDPAFNSLQNELKSAGYQETSSKVDPLSNESGSFKYDFTKGNQTSSIQGNMENEKITELAKWGSEDEKRLMDMLKENPRFKELEKSLTREGFNFSKGGFSFPQNNITEFSMEYHKGNLSANITGKADINGNIKQIGIEKENEPQRGISLRNLAIFFTTLALSAGIFCALARENEKNIPQQRTASQPKEDPEIVFIRRVEESERLCLDSKISEAYSELSHALRSYFGHILREDYDMTDQEFLGLLEKNPLQPYEPIKAFLTESIRVKFAKKKGDADLLKEMITASKNIKIKK